MANEKWYTKAGGEGEIVISTRIRFARNIAEYPFSGKTNSAQQRELMDKANDAVQASKFNGDFRMIELEGLSALELRALVERHIISPDLVEGNGPRGVLVSGDESVCVMIGEEDHLRIQVMGAGLQFRNLLERAEEIDDVFDSAMKYAFDEKLGYLTKCPTNLGTGMRASAMLHLPALTENGGIREIIAGAGKLGFAVRGLYGEGTRASGCIYQISNQMSLGFSESEIVERLEELVGQIIEHEKQGRLAAFERTRIELEDKVWRAAGIMQHARRMTSAEAMSLISDLRVGCSLGIISAPPAILNDLLWAIQPAGLALSSHLNNPAERDSARASLLRKAMSKIVDAE